jgi:hypothetical protein
MIPTPVLWFKREDCVGHTLQGASNIWTLNPFVSY